ncbi:MAG: hypothetical protein QM710_00005 [Flavobacterium sp.]
MQEFKISEDRYKEITKATLIKAVPIMVLAMSAGITIFYVNTKDQQNEINTFPYMIPFMILLNGFYNVSRCEKANGTFQKLQLRSKTIQLPGNNTIPQR